MTMLLGDHTTPAYRKPVTAGLIDLPRAQAARDEPGYWESGTAKTKPVFEHSKRQELMLTRSAAQILMAIVRNADTRYDRAG